MTQLVTTKRICDHLEKFVFDCIWNEPYSEFRRHITPHLLNPRSECHVEYTGATVPVGASEGVRTVVDCSPVAGMLDCRLGKILLPPYNQKDLDTFLPVNGEQRFYVYSVPANFFGPVKVEALEWTNLATYCSSHLLNLQVFTRSGCFLNRGFIYIRQADHNDFIFMAIDAAMYERCVSFGSKVRISPSTTEVVPLDRSLYVYEPTIRQYMNVVWHDASQNKWLLNPDYVDGDGTDAHPYTFRSGLMYFVDDDVIVGHYFDSDLQPHYRTLGYTMTPAQAVVGEIGGTFATVNGRLITGEYKRFLTFGDYVEETYDDDIIAQLDIVPGENTVYTGKDGKDRLLVHIPKTVNPNNLTITPNTCDLWLIPVNDGTAETPCEVSGVYVTLAGNGSGLHQLTHCDFSLNMDLLESIKTHYGFDKFYLRVMVRTHGKTKKLTRDAAYIDQLYTLDDNKIVEFMMGKEPVQTRDTDPILLFWKASEMEDSLYADALIRDRYKVHQLQKTQCEVCGMKDICPHVGRDNYVCENFNARSIQDYVGILGYYHVLALIGRRMSHFKVLSRTAESVIVTSALALSGADKTSQDFFPIVYLNGERVPQDRLEIETTSLSKQVGVAEIHRGSSGATNILENLYATRLKITIKDQPVLTKHFMFHEDTDYYHYVEGELVKGEPGVDYNVNDVIPDDLWYVMEKSLKVGDYIAVELCDNDSDHQIYRYRREDVPQPSELQMNTEDDWKIFKIVPTTTSIEGEHTVRYEYVPDPGEFDYGTKILTLDPALLTGVDILVVEGSHVKESKTDDLDVGLETYDRFGSGFFPMNFVIAPSYTEGYKYYYLKDYVYHYITVNSLADFVSAKATYGTLYTVNRDNFPFDDSLVFLNGRRLVKNLDFTVDGYPVDVVNTPDRGGADLLCQNLSYLKEKNTLSMVRTCTTPIFTQRGFVVGDTIAWKGQVPFWFDELSSLTIDGHFCSCFSTDLGNLIITEVVKHRNGAPYEITTGASTKIIRILNAPEGETTDRQRILELREYFTGVGRITDDMRTIIPHSHTIHSLYMGAMIKAYYTTGATGFDFSLPGEKGRINGVEVWISEENFLNQDAFKQFEHIKGKDLAYTLTDEELAYVDVYPFYHRLQGSSYDTYHKLAYLIKRLEPLDPIKHKEATYV